MSLKLSKDIKMVVCDFDGVFTDNSLFLSQDYNKIKKLNYKDIMGVSLLIKNGFNFGIISGEDGKILEFFTDSFDCTEIHSSIRAKGEKLQEIMERLNYSSDEIIYIGDDVNDIPAMELVKYKIAPRNVNQAVVKRVKNLQITNNYGGDGAVREVVDTLLELL